MENKILKVLILSIIFVCICSIKSYAEDVGTVRMEIKKGGTAWTNINVSDSYAVCERLNSASSTLGTTMLEAHLTTDADWSAMAIFSASQYGGATTNNPTYTNGNESGIWNIETNLTQTTGILNTATRNSTRYISGLFNEDGTAKKYVKQWPDTRVATNFVGFTDTYRWFGSIAFFGSSNKLPISIKNGLFGIIIGYDYADVPSGGPSSNVTFRPVIWN